MKKRDNDVAFVKQLINNIKVQTNVAQIGRVVSLNDDKTKASIQPMTLNQDGTKRAMLLGVHIGLVIQELISVGSVVVVLFMDRSLENWDNSNKDFALTNTRMHSMNDAFVVEVYS